MIRMIVKVCAASLFLAWATCAGAAVAQTFDISKKQGPVTMLSGDSWQQGGRTLKLYGVQSCIRGTYYTDHNDVRQDCGGVASIYLAALIKDTDPDCTPVAVYRFEPGTPATTLATCRIVIAGSALDLGAVVISQGFASAAVTTDGKVVYAPYAALEEVARRAKVGLWSFPDFPDPNKILADGGTRQ